ncbi:MAG: hypothetical protein IJV45_08525 [Prevotella sp.]|nr:hypothetical protein [Prevotella sp.]
MKKGLFTLIACIATLTTAMAQQAGDYFYTNNGRYQITTGENLLPNGDFADGTNLWITDSGDELDASIFSIEPDGPDGNYYLHVLYKEDGPGTPTTLLRRLPVVGGTTYYISYMVKAEQEVTTSVSATDMNGDVVFHIYGSYTGTCFDAFKVMEASRVVDDREVDALINRWPSSRTTPSKLSSTRTPSTSPTTSRTAPSTTCPSPATTRPRPEHGPSTTSCARTTPRPRHAGR